MKLVSIHPTSGRFQDASNAILPLPKSRKKKFMDGYPIISGKPTMPLMNAANAGVFTGREHTQ
jgi:hypothetical protein